MTGGRTGFTVGFDRSSRGPQARRTQSATSASTTDHDLTRASTDCLCDRDILVNVSKGPVNVSKDPVEGALVLVYSGDHVARQVAGWTPARIHTASQTGCGRNYR